MGGAVCGSKAFCEAVVNFGRAYIYSTEVPAGIACGITLAIEVMREEKWRQQRVRQIARGFREAMRIGGGESPIVPVVLGNEQEALRVSQRLLVDGFLVPAVRPPTVPRATSRLRVTLSCEHSDEDVERLIAALRRATGSG
jgi:8-amino-7-oxononanoate synthase